MKNIIKISNLNFNYKDKNIFNNLDLNIKQGSFTSIIGPNGSGKSTLMDIIVGLKEVDANIVIDGITLSKNTLIDIRKKIGIVFEDADNTFVTETVRNELSFSLENLKYDKKDIDKKIKEISELLNIKDILDKNPHNLSGGQKQLVALGCALVINPKILILDESLSMLDEKERTKILKLLVDINKSNNTTIINITHNPEDILYGSDIVIINKGKVVKNGPTNQILSDEKLFKDNKLELPFVVDLSFKLKYYGLVDNIILDMDELVNEIWK